ncbi:MAG: SPFH domain-containing protein [Geminicoccaceae bacterium]|nr:SPFH domain-containing protein [Geminicoccaceae bacterium]
MDKIFGEFVDVIEWTDDSPDTLVWRFERYGNEIKHGAKLTVREGQKAVFVNEGEIADVFGPGMYELLTANLPILSTLQNWHHGFESPFKAEVYFFNMRRFTDMKWGTKNPVIVRDPEFGPVRLRAFGTYVFRITEPAVLLREIVGTDNHFTTHEISDQLRNLIVTRFAAVLGSSGIPLLDLAANNDQLSNFVTGRIAPEFANYGLELTKLLVENVSLPREVEEAMDRRTSMGMVGDLRRYTQFQAAEAMRAAASNPADGSAGAGIGLGMGMAMAQQMASALNQTGQPQPAPAAQQGGSAAVPPPLQPAFHVAKDGKPAGPFDPATLAAMAGRGEFSRDTLVWTQGMSGWEKAGSVSALAGLFGAAPPPLPGGLG